MRAFLLLLLAAGLFLGGRRLLYPTESLTTGDGHEYDVIDLERKCIDGICGDVRFFLTEAEDEEQATEAATLAAHMTSDVERRGDRVIVVIAVEPGPLRLLPPKHGRMYLYGLDNYGRWIAAGRQDVQAGYRGFEPID